MDQYIVAMGVQTSEDLKTLEKVFSRWRIGEDASEQDAHGTAWRLTHCCKKSRVHLEYGTRMITLFFYYDFPVDLGWQEQEIYLMRRKIIKLWVGTQQCERINARIKAFIIKHWFV